MMEESTYPRPVSVHQEGATSPYAYLRYLFTQLPTAKTVEEIEKMLPGNMTAEQMMMLT